MAEHFYYWWKLFALVIFKAWFPLIRLTYSYVYSYENKYNPILLRTLRILQSLYVNNIIEIKERPLRHILLLTSSY